METGAEVRTLDFPRVGPGEAVAAIEAQPRWAVSRRLRLSISPRVQLFEIATGHPVGPVLEHKNTVFGAAFSPDSRMLLTGSTDSTARLWAVPGGEPLARPLDLHRTVHLVAFAPDGRSLATQDGDLVRLWALPEEGLPMVRVAPGRQGLVRRAQPRRRADDPDRDELSQHRARSEARGPFASRPADRPGRPSAPGASIVDAAFSPDGRSVATLGARDGSSTEGQEVVVWDWASGRAVLAGDAALRAPEPVLPPRRPPPRRALRRRGAARSSTPTTAARPSAGSAHEAEPAHHWINNGKVGFSPDGRSVLTWGMGNDVRVWEADTGRLRYPPLRHRDKCHDLQFSPDGRLMALASYDGSVRVRDLATGTVLAELPAHPDSVYSAGFSPDGRLLVTACRDRTVRVWDWRAGRLACPPFEHAKDAVAATFTPDGRWVLSASVDGTARAWDWRTGKPVTPPLTIEGEPLSLAVTPDGKHAVVGGFQDALAVLDLGDLAPSRRRPGRPLPLGRAARRPAAPRGGRHGQPVGRRVARPLAGVPPAIARRQHRRAPLADLGAAPSGRAEGPDNSTQSPRELGETALSP